MARSEKSLTEELKTNKIFFKSCLANSAETL